MKKWIKNSLWLVSIVVVCGMIAGGTVVSKYYGDRFIYDFELAAEKNFNRNEHVEFMDDETNDAINALNSSDINIFFVHDGVQPFYNNLRLAMLSKTETHYFYSSNSPLVKNINFEKFENFIKNERSIYYRNKENELIKINNDSSAELKAYEAEIRNVSSVRKLGIFYIDELIKNVKDIMINNKDKKINLWINSDNLRFYLPLIELAQVNNLIIRGLEDSNIIGKYISDNLHIKLSDWLKYELEDVGKSDEQIKKYVQNSFYVNRSENYLLPKIYKNIYYYFSYQNDVDKLKLMGYENIKLLSKENKEIKDYIFEYRTKNNSRMFSYWPEIIGLDWEKIRDSIKVDKNHNNKKSMIILGTSLESEWNFVMHVVDKYKDEYNIYYKGHPGHNKLSDEIEEFFKFSEDEEQKVIFYKDYSNGENKKIAINRNDIIRTLESQIPSEEFTTNHANLKDETRSLWFDAWVLCDPTSGAVSGIVNYKNQFYDIKEMWINQNDQDLAVSKGDDIFENYINSYINNFANNFIQVSLKNDNYDELTKDNLTINIKEEYKNLVSIDIKDIIYDNEKQGGVVLGVLKYNANNISVDYDVMLNIK